MPTTPPYGQENPATMDPARWAPPPAVRRATDWERLVRNWLIVLALVVLSLSLLTALVAANQAITIWLRPQYAPFVRAAGGLAVAGAALAVVLRLVRRGA